jgi:hypothetical protein
MKLEQTESMSFEDLYDSRDQGASAVNSEMMSPSISRHSGYKIYSYPSVSMHYSVLLIQDAS